MIKSQTTDSVFPFERKYSKARVINIYILILSTTLFFGSISAYIANDVFSAIFLFSSAVFASTAFIFNRLKLYNIAKSFILVLIAFIIFFYDSYDGAKSAAYLFYFPLSLAIVHIYEFDNKRERLFIYFHFLLNVFLISLNFITDHTLFTSDFISPESIKQFFFFNFTFSVLCISYFIYLIVHLNISQKRLIKNLTAEMLKSKTSEENKNTNTDILLAELQHRLKNNLSLMSSLIRLKMEFIKPDNFEVKINEVSHSIQVVADANRFVIFSNDSLTVPIKIYFEEVISSWMALKTSEKIKAKITLDIADHEINIKQAIPLALIIHEIIALFCTQKECESVLSHLRFTIKTPEIVVINSSVSELLEIAEISEYLIKELMEQIDAELIIHDQNQFEIRCNHADNQKMIESEAVFN